MLSLIVAASTNNAIGKNGQLLWHLPNDLKYFKNTTWGMPVIMGRKSFESVGRPLPGRFNIVITRQADWNSEYVETAANVNDAIEKAGRTNCKELFIIGGGEIYEQTIGNAQRIYMTRVHAVLDADTFFPPIDETKWIMSHNLNFEADDKHPFVYSFQVWDRR